jgi:YegS/Rv2252/BmrU family lipid kinase
VTVVPTTHRGHAAELAAASRREGFDLVICCGGDGTLNETVRGLLSLPPEERPELGYIPAGSTNDFAASLGLPASPAQSAEIAVTSPAHFLDVGQFVPVGEDASPARQFTYIASFGVFTAASYTTPQAAKNVMGHAAYLVEGVKDLVSLQPRHARFELSDGETLEDDYVFCAVTNTTSAGGIIQLPKKDISFSDGLFEVLLIKHPKTPAELNRIVTALLTVNLSDCPLISFRHTNAVKTCVFHNVGGDTVYCARK